VDEIPDWAILAMLSLAFAWRALRDVLYHQKAEDDADVIEQVRVAESIMWQSQRRMAKEDADLLEGRIKQMEHVSDLGRRPSKKQGAFARARQEQQQAENWIRSQRWLEFLITYRERHPDASRRECVIKLMEHYYPHLKGKVFKPEKQPLFRAMLKLAPPRRSL
jgi:hypothetical protein